MDSKSAQQYLVRRISSEERFEQLLDFPRYLEIETVNVCNARCPMCTIGDWKRGSKPMTDALFAKIADEISENATQVKRVSLYRDGEPLIDRKLPARIKRLKQGGVREVSIATNVSLLDAAKAREVLEAGLDTVILSIDSLKKEVFESIRVRLKFEEVLENALGFLALRDQIRPATRVWVRMIRQKNNQDEWPAYRDFWLSKLGPQDRCYYHNIFNWGGQLSSYSPISPSYEPGLPCVALWSLFVIFADGRVPLCNVDYNRKYPNGDVTTSSIRALWNSPEMTERRALHMQNKKSQMSLCSNCNVWDESPDRAGISKDYAEAHDIPRRTGE